ncbi:MAG: ATP-binding cassette domain-containing protein [Flavobacteriaceae bacterium]|nr:ATP-binding cassette domain-containing protein [Flavobacteriaceae bacterium]
MLRVENLTFSYKETPVLEDISFELEEGRHLAVMGESGGGKSTLLRIIYGLLHLDEGSVYWKEKKVLGPNFQLVPGEENMKYLSQEFDLMPFTTVTENVSQFLSVFYPDELAKRTSELLEMIEMQAFADAKIKTLSVGQKQRVALARAIAQKPELLLLDEPFSHIDNFQKNSLRRNLFDYLTREGITCITATHDALDVLPYADRILVIRDQKIIANRPVQELYDQPRSLYVASLFGEASLVPIDILKSYADTKRRIIVYAHEFKVSPNSGIPTVVERSYPMGSHYLVKGWSEGEGIYFHSHEPIAQGKKVFLNVSLGTINKRMKQ